MFCSVLASLAKQAHCSQGYIKVSVPAVLLAFPSRYSPSMEAFMASQLTTPLYPIPRFLPRELALEGDLDVYEPAHVLFKRMLKFVNRPAYADLTSEEVQLFLKNQISPLVHASLLYSVCQVLTQPDSF